MSSQTHLESASVFNLVNKVIGCVSPLLDSPGDMASLRRLTPADHQSPVFWRIATVTFAESELSPDLAPRWACFLQALGQLGTLLHKTEQGGQPLGTALAASGFAEMRLLKLLRAKGALLFDEVRVAAHFLAHKGQQVNARDLGLLVLLGEGPALHETRDRIAFAYYRQLRHAKSSSRSSEES